MIVVGHGGAEYVTLFEGWWQATKPGNYTMKANFINTGANTYEYVLVFDDPEDEVLYRLKYE